MIAIVDYGVGNLFSLQCSLDAIGASSVVTADENVIKDADKLILPGVGAFADAAQKLPTTGLDRAVVGFAASGQPLLGICLGMQMLFEESIEYGRQKGLGLLSGHIAPISDVIPKGLKVPHIGWNALHFTRETPLFSRIKEGDCVYFVHSYYARNCEDSLVAVTDYGVPLTAAVQKGNIYGCQFHPEKSGEVGLNILRSFCFGEAAK